MRSDTKSGTVVAGILVALASLAIGWSLRAFFFPSAAAEGTDDDEQPAPAVAPEQMSVRVTTARVTQGELPVVVVAAGVVLPAPDAERALSSRAGGRVEAVFVTEGETVEPGHVLLRFESGPLDTALAQARAVESQADSQLVEFERTGRTRQGAELTAAAARAKSALDLAQMQLARLEGLQGDGLVSDKALAEARQGVEQARADESLAQVAAGNYESTNAELQHQSLVAARTAAEAALHDAERIRAEAEVRAPAGGRVVQMLARAGEKIDAGATLGKLLVTDARVVRFSVATGAARELEAGARASWSDASGTTHAGHVVRSAGQIDDASGLIDVFVAPDAGAPALTPGLTVRGELEVRRLTNALLVPDAAVVRAADELTVVLATADDRARSVHVKVLGRHGGLAAVEGELRAGDRVITAGAYNLPDGARIVEAGAQPTSDGK